MLGSGCAGARWVRPQRAPHPLSLCSAGVRGALGACFFADGFAVLRAPSPRARVMLFFGPQLACLCGVPLVVGLPHRHIPGLQAEGLGVLFRLQTQAE